MIKIPSRDLDKAVSSALRRFQKEVNAERDFARRVELASARFSQRNRPRNPTFREIRKTLAEMCTGARRCMYCEDSVADEVEHHRPKNLYPELVFEWDNYLYACGPCNSPKNNRFAIITAAGRLVEVIWRKGNPVVAPQTGVTALLDPRMEDPLDYMMLDIAGDTFLFAPIAIKEPWNTTAHRTLSRCCG